ncbi:equilibrative nucleoside transporter 1 [Stylonychia lemnae]|uniref:Equilibrative nucleoside transporter 1 n=1 Tax=Stylonychia lemnae TaxID=5949 RepID=A0A078B9C2_STYLE|nr:equilibrative nucleoside transporter 1 [Stylonychia lemnae]|eukprot:CDW90989.1 equilibrative nucleoside transporter 1 [Stylonychia lemnae]
MVKQMEQLEQTEAEVFSSKIDAKESKKIQILMNFYGLGGHPEFLYNMILNFSFVGGQTFLVKLLIKLDYKPRLIVMFIPLIILQIALPFIVQYIESKASWNVSILFMVLIGTFMGNIISTFCGIGGLLGPQYMGSYFQGLSLSSIFACILRLICLLLFDSSNELSYFYSTLLYFSLNAVIQIILCLTLPLSHVKQHLFLDKVQSETQPQKLETRDIKEEEVAVNTNQQDEIVYFKEDLQADQLSERNITNDQKVNYITIYKKIWVETTFASFTFLLTYLLFPGIIFQGGMTISSNFVWNIFYYNASFNVGDYSGRFLAKLKKQYGRVFIIIGGLLRLIWIASTFIIAFNHQNIFWGNNAVIVINCYLLGMTHGFLGACCNQSFGGRLENHEKEHGGFMISVLQSLGVAFGSLISLVAFKDMF